MKLGDIRERGWDVEVYSMLPGGYEERLTVREIHEIPGFANRRTVLKVIINPPLSIASETGENL